MFKWKNIIYPNLLQYTKNKNNLKYYWKTFVISKLRLSNHLFLVLKFISIGYYGEKKFVFLNFRGVFVLNLIMNDIFLPIKITINENNLILFFFLFSSLIYKCIWLLDIPFPSYYNIITE